MPIMEVRWGTSPKYPFIKMEQEMGHVTVNLGSDFGGSMILLFHKLSQLYSLHCSLGQLSVFRGSAWEWSEERAQFYYHQFLAAQPDLNFRCNAVRQEMKVGAICSITIM